MCVIEEEQHRISTQLLSAVLHSIISVTFHADESQYPTLKFTTSPQTIANNLPPDADDEAMQRYKQSLGIGGTGKDLSDASDPRHCIILSLQLDSAGRPPVTIDLSAKGSEATLKDKPFKIKEGVKFNMTAKFKVQHEILSGLHYVQIVKRKGIRVSKDQEMIVG